MKKAAIRRYNRSGGAVYLNIGGDRSVPCAGILGIFDFDLATLSPASRQFLRESQKRGQVITVSESLPKSFLIWEDGIAEQVYISPFTAAALRGRLEE